MTYRGKLWQDIAALQLAEVESREAIVATRMHRTDGLPEFKDYRDTGCEVAPECLKCPLPKCRYDEYQGLSKMRTRGRLAEINAMLASGMTARAVAVKLSISTRTIFRLRRANA